MNAFLIAGAAGLLLAAEILLRLVGGRIAFADLNEIAVVPIEARRLAERVENGLEDFHVC